MSDSSLANRHYDVVVLGTGAIGGVTAARLSVFGRKRVLCVDSWVDHVIAMQSGLRYIHPDGSLHVATVAAVTPNSLAVAPLASVSLAVISCKSQDSKDYLELIAPMLAHDAGVISLQNGMNEIDIAAKVGEHRTIGGVVLMDGELTGPGEVRSRRQNARLILGSWTSEEATGRRLRALSVETLRSGIDTVEWSANIRDELASKLVKNCIINAVTALCDYSVAELFRDDALVAIISSLTYECTKVMSAAGYRLDPDVFFGQSPEYFLEYPEPSTISAFWRRARQLYPPEVLIVSSMLHDVRVGRGTEIAALNGRIVEMGRHLGVATPWNSLLVALIGRVESGSLRIGVEGREALLDSSSALR